MSSLQGKKSSNLDKPLSKGKAEINVATFALLFSEIVQYCQNRVYTVPELQNKDRGFKRETKHLNMLLFIKGTFWRTLFGKDADKLEQANEDESLVNKFISVPKDRGSLNCAAFTAGIIEAVLNGANFPAKVTAHYHKGTTFMIKFDESVIARDKPVEGK
ncbi:TPPC5-like protein [Mya arenaria]|uniref:Trafficking protein particle complex subunit 5 n=1 Tax=Mya arenaria TaxID=6604 RepID=A0ABY7FQD6_MYAAR|nr:TPPC5-like protein [Mya arenaria]